MNIATISKQIRAFADQLDATSEVEKPDPYAELKAAHAAGKVIQILNTQNRYVDADPTWQSPPEAYRIKPTESAKPEPAFQLPPPPPGMRWHREDGWTADDLPSGYRPLVDGENWVAGDEMLRFAPHGWQIGGMPGDILDEPTHSGTSRCRTTRPLVFDHAGKKWTWHRPGDPMPCDGDRDVCCLVMKGGRRETNPAKGCYVGWSVTDEKLHFWGVIIGWRYAEPQTKTVPQSSTFFLPGTVIRLPDATDLWGAIMAINQDGLVVGDTYQSYQEIATSKAMANRSIPLTGKWNPDAWEPCSKTIPA